MQVRIFRNADLLADAAADVIADVIKNKPGAVLGLATGASPVKTYARLIEKYKSGEISFRDVRTFNLDEYIGLAPSDPNSYHWFMKANLFDSVDIDPDNTHVPDGCAADPESYGKAYDGMIDAAGGIDLQLLGIGVNGHIGFNEPAEDFACGTHVTALAESTIAANSKYFGDESLMPKTAITMGIGNIMKARSVLLIATGESKARSIKQTIEGEVTPLFPASALQQHPDAKIFLDEAAASLLDKKEI